MPLAARASEVCCHGFWISHRALEPSVRVFVSTVFVGGVCGSGEKIGEVKGGEGERLTFFEEAGLAGGLAGCGVVLDPTVAEAGWNAPC
jgi:hypothetical protein